MVRCARQVPGACTIALAALLSAIVLVATRKTVHFEWSSLAAAAVSAAGLIITAWILRPPSEQKRSLIATTGVLVAALLVTGYLVRDVGNAGASLVPVFGAATGFTLLTCAKTTLRQ